MCNLSGPASAAASALKATRRPSHMSRCACNFGFICPLKVECHGRGCGKAVIVPLDCWTVPPGTLRNGLMRKRRGEATLARRLISFAGWPHNFHAPNPLHLAKSGCPSRDALPVTLLVGGRDAQEPHRPRFVCQRSAGFVWIESPNAPWSRERQSGTPLVLDRVQCISCHATHEGWQV